MRFQYLFMLATAVLTIDSFLMRLNLGDGGELSRPRMLLSVRAFDFARSRPWAAIVVASAVLALLLNLK